MSPRTAQALMSCLTAPNQLGKVDSPDWKSIWKYVPSYTVLFTSYVVTIGFSNSCTYRAGLVNLYRLPLMGTEFIVYETDICGTSPFFATTFMVYLEHIGRILSTTSIYEVNWGIENWSFLM